MIMETTTHTTYSPPSKRTIFHPNLQKKKLNDWTIKRLFKRKLFCFPLAFTWERNFFQNSKVNMLTVGFIPLFVFEKPYKNINKHNWMPSAHRSCRYLPPNERLSNSRRKFAYNSCALFYMCCKYNILLTWEMWTIIVSTAITLQTVETTCPNGNVVYASELAMPWRRKHRRTRIRGKIRKFSKKQLTSTIRQPFNHLYRDERKFAESNQAISKREMQALSRRNRSPLMREQPRKSWLESPWVVQQMLTPGRENALSVSSMHKPHNLAV